ncbi:MAG: fused DSP-PTPase phosphatase/NAD kinase-like protein [Armatimonadota bacterium]
MDRGLDRLRGCFVGLATESLPESGREVEPPARSYWIEPGRVLGGCYPGALEAAKERRKVGRLLDCGVRTFVDLTEAGEEHRGQLLRPYEETVAALARERGLQVTCRRFPIEDLNVPTMELMAECIRFTETALARGRVYVHCLGGVGRTGTFAACWLLTRGVASAQDVFGKLAELRTLDRVRGSRKAPEREVQCRFVRDWAEMGPFGRAPLGQGGPEISRDRLKRSRSWSSGW